MDVPEQSSPEFDRGGNVFGRIAAQWNAYFAAKVDVVDGILINPTFLGTVNFTYNQIIAALGFVPLNPTNNLSDVASTAIARANLGAFGVANVSKFGASTSLGDNTTQIQNALNSGARTIVVDVFPLITLASVSVPRGVTLTGTSGWAGGLQPLSTSTDYPTTADILLDNAATISTGGVGAQVVGLRIINKNLSTPTTMRSFITAVKAFAGDAITINKSDCHVANCLILGFNRPVFGTDTSPGIQADRTIIENLTTDNTNGVVFGQSRGLASFVGSTSGTVLTISSMTSGSISIPVFPDFRTIGDVTGKLVNGTTISVQISGTTGGAGTYTISPAQTVSSEAMTSGLGTAAADTPKISNVHVWPFLGYQGVFNTTERISVVGADSSGGKIRLRITAPNNDKDHPALIAGDVITVAQVSGTDATIIGTIAATVLTVSFVYDGGIIHTNDVIQGVGVTAGTTITGQASGVTGGIGTYNLSASMTVATPEVMNILLPGTNEANNGWIVDSVPDPTHIVLANSTFTNAFVARCAFTATIDNTGLMNVTAVTAPGRLYGGAVVGDLLGNVVSGTYITQQLTGSLGSTGHYQVNIPQVVTSQAMMLGGMIYLDGERRQGAGFSVSNAATNFQMSNYFVYDYLTAFNIGPNAGFVTGVNIATDNDTSVPDPTMMALKCVGTGGNSFANCGFGCSGVGVYTASSDAAHTTVVLLGGTLGGGTHIIENEGGTIASSSTMLFPFAFPFIATPDVYMGMTAAKTSIGNTLPISTLVAFDGPGANNLHSDIVGISSVIANSTGFSSFSHLSGPNAVSADGAFTIDHIRGVSYYDFMGPFLFRNTAAAGATVFDFAVAANGFTFAYDLFYPTGHLTAVVFGALPASPVTGAYAAVTDSNTVVWGATIAGGGSNHVLAFYNGTNWTVAGK